MAKTAFTTNNALTKKIWEERLFRDWVKESYFSRFMSERPDSVVHVNSDLTKSKGDRITFGLRMRLSGDGVTSGQQLEGNEEKLTTHDFSLSLERYRHAVRDNGDLDRQRPMFDIDMESDQAIRDWGSEKIDQLAFDAILASHTTVFYTASGTNSKTGTPTTAKSALTATDKLTPGLLSHIRTWCMTGGNRTQTPIKPIRINGKNYFVALVHPDVMHDLKQDATFSQARREALERGKDNPIFSGSEAIWDGVVRNAEARGNA